MFEKYASGLMMWKIILSNVVHHLRLGWLVEDKHTINVYLQLKVDIEYHPKRYEKNVQINIKSIFYLSVKKEKKEEKN